MLDHLIYYLTGNCYHYQVITSGGVTYKSLSLGIVLAALVLYHLKIVNGIMIVSFVPDARQL
ncbi:hypothetical protein GQX74_003078 [Glossina fuscipes]|nr:hypothetical protein GQX74_003078 [Glossina fuscipes]